MFKNSNQPTIKKKKTETKKPPKTSQPTNKTPKTKNQNKTKTHQTQNLPKAKKTT